MSRPGPANGDSPAGIEEFFTLSPDILVIADFDYRFRDVSPACERVLGWSVEEMLSRPYLELVHPEDRARTREEADRIARQEDATPGFENRYRHKDGSYRWLLWSIVGSASNGLIYAVAKDVTERRGAEDRLRKSEAQLAEAERTVQLGSWEWDIEADQIIWSRELYRIFGQDPAAVAPSYEAYLELSHPEDREQLEAAVRRALADHEPFSLHHRILRPDGGVPMLHCHGRVITDDQGVPVRMIGTAQDVTERQRAEEHLAHQALHDPLTGLPNRLLFTDRLEHALARRGREKRTLAVLFLDLDDFKRVNDTRGHRSGDELLRAIGQRFRSHLRPADTVARFGGDEFVILGEDLSGERDAIAIAERVGHALSRPFALAGDEHSITASIGIALAAPEDRRPELLIHDADAAMYRAKGRGGGRYELHDRRSSSTPARPG